jgi:hypothetical protein
MMLVSEQKKIANLKSDVNIINENDWLKKYKLRNKNKNECYIINPEVNASLIRKAMISIKVKRNVKITRISEVVITFGLKWKIRQEY